MADPIDPQPPVEEVVETPAPETLPADTTSYVVAEKVFCADLKAFHCAYLRQFCFSLRSTPDILGISTPFFFSVCSRRD